MKKKLSNWKANSLSQADRSALIKSNLNSQTNYMMQNFLLPKVVLEHIYKINKNYFSNKLSSANYRSLICWNKVCSSKDNGGLGIKLAKNMNEVCFILNYLGKLFQNQKIVGSKLLNKNIRDDIFSAKKNKTSWQFGRLLSLREKFNKWFEWLVGNGKKIYEVLEGLLIWGLCPGSLEDRMTLLGLFRISSWQTNYEIEGHFVYSFLHIYMVDRIRNIRIPIND